MKIWLATLLLLIPVLAWAEPEESDESPAAIEGEVAPAGKAQAVGTWVDSTHEVAAESTQALVEWMDDFFGDPEYDLEKAESFLRLEFENDWEQGEGNDFGVRLRGKLQLPKISQRVDLLFSDEDNTAIDGEEREDVDTVALRYKVRETTRSRFDATMGFSSGHLKPGVRYRNEGALENRRSYRYTQRLQYEDGDGFFTLGQVDLFQVRKNEDVLRWSNRFKYGEHTDGVEWRTRLSLFQRWYEDTKRPLAVNYFGTILGETRPKGYVKNYRLGAIVRRQVYRDFLFFEIEPAINYRQDTYYDDRDWVWSVALRLEIHLSRDFIRNNGDGED